MALTAEYIDQIADTDFTPELETRLMDKIAARATTYLSSKGNVVKAKADYDKEIETESETRAEKKKDEWAKSDSPKYYKAVEMMLKAFGTEFEKPDGISVAKHVENLVGKNLFPLKPEQIDKLTKALEAQADGSSTNKQDALIAKYKQELDDLKLTQTKKETEAFAAAVTSDIKKAFKAATIPVDTTLTTEAAKKADRQNQLDVINTLFSSKYEGVRLQDNSIAYKKKGADDKAIEVSTDDDEAMTPLEIMQRDFPRLFAPAGRQAAGGGTGGKTDSGTEGGELTLEKIVKEAGRLHRMGTKEYNDYIAEQSKLLKKK